MQTPQAVTFRCRQSGNTVSFVREDDIQSMRKETEYDEVVLKSEEQCATPVPETTPMKQRTYNRKPKIVDEQPLVVEAEEV